MTTKTKVYKIKVPLTLQEWRKGSRYILTKLTTSEVQIVYHTTESSGGEITTKTHKILDVKQKIPYIIRKLIPDTACIVDEFSTNIDSVMVTLTDPAGNTETAQVYNVETKLKNKEGLLEAIDTVREDVVVPDRIADQLENINLNEERKDGAPGRGGAEKMVNHCTTVYKNRYFDAKTFSLEVRTAGTHVLKENIFDLDKAFKEEFLDFRTCNHAKIARVGERDYSGDWESSYPCTIIYKLVDVSVNSFGLGWVAAEVDRMIRNLLVSVQQKIIQSYDDWVHLSEKEISDLENDMVQRFIIRVE